MSCYFAAEVSLCKTATGVNAAALVVQDTEVFRVVGGIPDKRRKTVAPKKCASGEECNQINVGSSPSSNDSPVPQGCM